MNADQRTEESVGMRSRSSAFRRVVSFSILSTPDERAAAAALWRALDLGTRPCIELGPRRRLGVVGSSSLPGTSDPVRSSVRELRQRRAYYRCCIPALAGFVSLRSIAPDGFSIIRSDASPEQRLLCAGERASLARPTSRTSRQQISAVSDVPSPRMASPASST